MLPVEQVVASVAVGERLATLPAAFVAPAPLPIAHVTPPAPHPDAEIFDAIATRNPHAVALLNERYGKLATSVAFNITGDARVTERVVQHVIMSVWRAEPAEVAARLPVHEWIFSLIQQQAYREMQTPVALNHAAKRPPGRLIAS